MTRLPAGTYQPGYSLIHDMHAAVKLVCLTLLLVSVVSTDSLPGYLVSIAATVAIVYLAQVDTGVVLLQLRRLLWFFLLILLLNTCLGAPRQPWLRWWIFAPSREGLLRGAEIVCRLALLVALGNVLFMTTPPLKLTDGIGRLLSPLRTLGIPTERVAMILSVAIQLIPALFAQAEKIRWAQTARGAHFDSRSYFEKARAAQPLVIPVFLAAFERADVLSQAMEARGYRAEAPHVVRKREKLTLCDALAILVCAALCATQTVIL